LIKEGTKFSLNFSILEQYHTFFVNTFKDDNPMHTNKEYASKYGFNDKVMHGNILCGFLSNFVGTSLPIKNVVIVSEEINFRSPFYLNDLLSFNATVKSVHDSVNLVELSFKFLKNDINIANGLLKIKILNEK
jgi:3-hydroxybutyryl-CoA dehydratase